MDESGRSLDPRQLKTNRNIPFAGHLLGLPVASSHALEIHSEKVDNFLPSAAQ